MSAPANPSAPVAIWADRDVDAPALFALPPAERLRRTLKKAALAELPLIVSDPADGPLSDRLGAALGEANGPVIVVEEGAATDPRLITALARSDGPAVARTEEGTALRLLPGTALPSSKTLPELADALISSGVPRLQQADFDGFIGVLRRDLPYWILRPRNAADARTAERWMFLSNYKGSTDILTAHVFPPLVWPLTRWCAQLGISPNAVTIVSIVLTALAALLFWEGYLAAGLLAAYAMAVLDSVDGKLARVSLSDSALGNVLDHGLDIVHPPFWWLAWAHGAAMLGGPAWLWPAAWIMTAFYIADRLVLMVAKARFGRGLHAMTPLDGRVRSFISRRNINLLLLTIGLAIGLETLAFGLVVAWQAATCLWHAVRTAMLYPRGRQTA
ncbi:MAG: CDP-alcohol phosphatidyltransferase family protein [Pseudomonadota bacterium]